MLRSILAKLSVAVAMTVILVDLQVYMKRYHPRSDMFGSYLRRQVRADNCGKVPTAPLTRCPEETQGGRRISPTKSSSGVLRS
jgi:hypothetical protein